MLRDMFESSNKAQNQGILQAFNALLFAALQQY
jgi:hypothetical protein